MNWVRDTLSGLDPEALALVELARDGTRRTWTFGEVQRASGAMAGRFAEMGVERGDVVMTVVGNRPEWVFAMLACFHIGAVVLPCNEQLRSKDLRQRVDIAQPKLIVVDERDLSEVERVGAECRVLVVPDPEKLCGTAPPMVEIDADDACLLSFTSGTEGQPKAVVHVQRYLYGQELQARHWLDVRPGDVVWCTAASGWSKSARNAFIAPWLRGATAVIHDGRFDVDERVALITQERVNILCMAPTEYRLLAKRGTIARSPALRRLVAAGEALNCEVLEAWRDATGLEIIDGFGQTETGQLTGVPLGQAARPGSMGRPLPGVRLWVEDGELVLDPRSVPTFFSGYLDHVPAVRSAPWRTGDRVHEENGWFYFDGRSDDVIVSSGYRIGPFEVESALIAHPDVAEAAVVPSPDEARGQIVRAVIVLRDGVTGDQQLVRALQDHVKSTTAPYKYPRRIDFVRELPKTASGKVRRVVLRGDIVDSDEGASAA